MLRNKRLFFRRFWENAPLFFVFLLLWFGGRKIDGFWQDFDGMICEYAGFILARNGEVPVVSVTAFFIGQSKSLRQLPEALI